MTYSPISKKELTAGLPAEWPSALLNEIRTELQSAGRKIVVLDDDPTGTQTVYDIPILTEWSQAVLEKEFQHDSPGFYLLTNTRSLDLEQAKAINFQIGKNLRRVAQKSGADYEIISRSDSTLRGHFPGEVEALAGGTGIAYDGWILMPAFIDGGRITVNDVHYVDDGTTMIPAGSTEFSNDNVFGYQSSNLAAWMAEKFKGRIRAESIHSITIDDIRYGGPEKVRLRLSELTDGALCFANAASYSDIEVVVLGLLQAEKTNKQFMLRTAASFVRTRMGLDARVPLERQDLELSGKGGGLVVVGSHVPKTTAQLEYLVDRYDIPAVEIDVARLIDPDTCQNEIQRVGAAADTCLKSGRNVVVSTSRQLLYEDNEKKNIDIGQKISFGITRIIELLSTRPKFIVAKGGITSSDIATRSLRIKRAMVRGQIIPGVPVWRCGDETRYPGLNYIVFPGNVGGPEALYEVLAKLS